MLVMATKLGYYGERRRRVGEDGNGAVFEIEEEHFSPKWMKKIDADKRVEVMFGGKTEIISAKEVVEEERNTNRDINLISKVKPFRKGG